MGSVTAIIDDLRDEHAALRVVLKGLPRADWAADTPARGWTVHHQVAHLAFFDEAATLAATDPKQFEHLRAEADRDPPGFLVAVLEPYLAVRPDELLATWIDNAERMTSALDSTDTRSRVPWFGPSMSLTSKATARLMETWAHHQDITDALGLTRTPTDRLRHVAYIAHRAFPYSHQVNGLPVPEVSVGVRLEGPGGDIWQFGPADPDEVVSGNAEEFCLVMTRRRHVDDTRLAATGEVSRRWLLIGQTFAGDPGEGRRPGQFPHVD